MMMVNEAIFGDKVGHMYDLVVIGGGAAGMLASAVASCRGARVALLERNEQFGRKLRITGKGRCNVTNDCPVSEVLENITSGGLFLQSALNGFTPRDTIDFFESLGVPLKTERGARVFPQSDNASEIADALRRHMMKSGVAPVRGRALRLMAKEGRICGVLTSDGKIDCKAVILATGGMSYPATGSTGDGYQMARELGHKITPLRGSLVPLEAESDVCARMQGLTLKNVRLTVCDGGKKTVFEDFGELLFTHFGISGPLALSASAHMRDFDGKKYYALIDLKPALDEKKLDLRILRDFEKYSNRDFSNALGDLLSKTMIPVVIEKSGINSGTKVHSISREQRLQLVRLLKAFRIDIDRQRPIEEAIITSGGVDLREINPKTMESKIIRGLHFAGEIIDSDAYTGGYNLQIAWSTAHAAGSWVDF
ncbi:MAG: NAD(P)/FAD-dependent oxidoreductase [Oscillospiraceae bacterium]|jgi:predicted Rossmann fold flavoprotein|nr:NAD(P)/FAD-dependent oxidoreductase [Oscillospiraceae bacterium]